MENLKTISDHNEEYLKGIHSYYMGITSFADVTHVEFLSTYLGIENDILKQFLEIKNNRNLNPSNLNHWKTFIRDCITVTLKSIFQTFYKLFQCFCAAPLPLEIDLREKVRNYLQRFIHLDADKNIIGLKLCWRLSK